MPTRRARSGSVTASSANPEREWWRDAVVYQIYPRSFQDSDGDGIGDLAGIASRLDHLAWLGVDALWLSPIYPSPQADLGYDVADYTAVDPVYGSLGDLDRLIAAAHEREIRLLMDLVVSHTSIEHPWFREHPDWYVWADEPANNWRGAFGGSAWSRDPVSGRYYLHSFYPEQADLDWRNPEVREAIADIVGFWVDRGVDGFRVDAVTQLMKDPELRDEPVALGPPPLPLHPELADLGEVNARNHPEITIALAALREAAGDALLVGEVYLPSAQLAPYLDYFDLVFTFEFLHSSWDAEALAGAIASSAALERVAWVLSNHDFPRLAGRGGPEAAQLAALLLLTLPGAAFIYQGDEIGMLDGPGAQLPIDRAGRDAFRHPMQWQPTPNAGFTTSKKPWLPLIDPVRVSVAAQRQDEGSILHLYRRLIEMRRELQGDFELLDSPPGVIAFRRGTHLIAVNLGTQEQIVADSGEVVLVLADDGVGPLAAGAARVLLLRAV